MLVRFWLCLIVAVTLAGCSDPQAPRKVALLAPFENQYREIGYNALYAVRLALDDAGSDAQLLALDDGGSVELAVSRARAFSRDPAAAAIIALGPHATHPDTQAASQLPFVIIGNWGHDRAADSTLYAANAELAKAQSADDLLLLQQAHDLRSDLYSRQILGSGSLPGEDFRQRYLASGMYVPQPNALATLVYDVARMVFAAIDHGIPLADATHKGINGEIAFENGYWRDAPVNVYVWDAGELVMSAPSTTP